MKVSTLLVRYTGAMCALLCAWHLGGYLLDWPRPFISVWLSLIGVAIWIESELAWRR